MDFELKALQDFVITLGYPICVSIAMYFLLRASTARGDKLSERFIGIVERLMVESSSSRITIGDNTKVTGALSNDVKGLTAQLEKLTPCKFEMPTISPLLRVNNNGAHVTGTTEEKK